MSRGQFEELVDGLSAVLLTVDFGTKRSLENSLRRLEELDRFLVNEQRDSYRTVALAQAITAVSGTLKSPAITEAHTKDLQAQLETLTQFWYDEAKHWDRTTRKPENAPRPSALELPDTAEPALLADFITNARFASEELEGQINALRFGNATAADEIRRVIHSLKGEAGMLGLDEFARLLHATESYLELTRPVWERSDELLRVRDWMMDALHDYETGTYATNPVEPLISEMTEHDSNHVHVTPPAGLSPNDTITKSTPRIPASTVPGAGTTRGQGPITHSDAPPSTVPTTWDDQELELVVEFLHESEEAVATVDQTLLEIEQLGPDAERVNRLFRAFHTLKGVASFLRLKQIVELAHTTETMLDSVRSGRLSAETGVVDLVFDATTLLRSLLEAVKTALEEHSPLRKTDGVTDLVTRIRTTTLGNVPHGSVLPARPGTKLGEILLENGAISEKQLTVALDQQKETGRRLGEQLMSQGTVPAKVVAQALRGQNNNSARTTRTREVLKVDLERVDCLVETIGELVIVESMVNNAPEVVALPAHLRNYLGQFSKLTRELQELGMCMRMVPLRAEFQKMARMVRDLTRRSSKQVRIELRGESTEMDRSMVEQIADPLVHLIRNAVDHGIEPPNDRLAQGKSETGTIVLSAAHEGGSIVIELADDGRGINRERVIQKAVSQGLIAEGALLSDSQVYDLLFMPGFSTAAAVTEISGRGVGMDVVKRNIEAIRGRIITLSTPGRGTTFRLVLPLTLAIIDGMVIRCGRERFIVPTLNIIESLRPTSDMLFSIAGKNEHILVRGHPLPLMRLGRILDLPETELNPENALAVIVESMHTQVALLVDEVIMKHQVVIKTLSAELDVDKLFAGAAILSNGRVGLILNIDSIVETVRLSDRHSLYEVA